MKKLALIMLAAGMLIGANSFATDGGKKKKATECKKDDKCGSGEKSCCKKPSKSAMLKARPKAEPKKAA